MFHGANLALNSNLDQDTFGKVPKHNSQEVSPFPAGDHKPTRNRHDSTTHTNMKHNLQERSTKKHRLGTVSKNSFTGGIKPVSRRQPMWIKTHRYLVCMKDPYLINASSPRIYKSRYNKEIKQR